ncbi:MAG: hypothetical protein KGL39_37235 [Patescibacteria group bacterium]|nr:hypothetical protein [Patescibacteria group bacterium]
MFQGLTAALAALLAGAMDRAARMAGGVANAPKQSSTQPAAGGLFGSVLRMIRRAPEPPRQPKGPQEGLNALASVVTKGPPSLPPSSERFVVLPPPIRQPGSPDTASVPQQSQQTQREPQGLFESLMRIFKRVPSTRVESVREVLQSTQRQATQSSTPGQQPSSVSQEARTQATPSHAHGQQNIFDSVVRFFKRSPQQAEATATVAAKAASHAPESAAAATTDVNADMARAAQGLKDVATSLPGILRGLSEGVKSFGGEAASTIGRTAVGAVAGRIAGGGFGSLAGGAAGLASAAGGLAGGVGLVVGGLMFIAHSIERNRAFIAGNASLSGLSGGMQGAFQMLMAADYQRQAQRSTYLSQSTVDAVRAQNRFDNEWNRSTALLKQKWNDWFGVPQTNMWASALKWVNDHVGAPDLKGLKVPRDGLTVMAQTIANGKFVGPKFRGIPPKRWRGDWHP